jgi:tetratricopeptide (TPR) repeat protein
MTIENIAGVYVDKDDFDTALTYLSRALEMYKHVLPDQNPATARCLGRIGYVHEKKGDVDVALDYYHQQLKMDEQCLPFDHPDLPTHLGWIIDTIRRWVRPRKGWRFVEKNSMFRKID